MQLTTSEHAVLRLPCRTAAYARAARLRARMLLVSWGFRDLADLGELIVSELVANAIRHGDEPIWVRLSADNRNLRIEVHDGGAGRPFRRNPGADDESGRGLELVDGLIELHGGERGEIQDHSGPGKTVYVALSLADAR